MNKALDFFFPELLIFTGTLQLLEKKPHNIMPEGKMYFCKTIFLKKSHKE